VGLSVAKRCCLAVALLLGVAVFVSTTPSQARASTDVMFVIDTTGSMESAIQEAQEDAQEAMAQIATSLPDVQFGLASMADYGHDFVNYNGQPEISPYDDEIPTDIPWTLHQPITSNQSLISANLLKLTADGGGDGPEAYGRALFESAASPAIGWRPGARGVIVLIADNVPHDDELNQGIPEGFWVDSPFNTGIDPGADNTLGTGDDLDWQAVLQRLNTEGKPLEYVDYFGAPEYFPYWQNWTARTGGSALQANGENLAGQIVELVKAGATASLPACPTGLIRDASSRCATPSPPPPPPSNNFKIEPRISCAKGCYVVNVKIVFDSAGNVIAESVLDEEPAARSSNAGISKTKKGHKKKPKAQIKRLSQAVTPGVNTLTLKLTSSAKKTLKKKGSVKLKVNITFTPTGGSPKSQVHTFNVRVPAKPKKGHRTSK
jgi:hypothetical protein